MLVSSSSSQNLQALRQIGSDNPRSIDSGEDVRILNSNIRWARANINDDDNDDDNDGNDDEDSINANDKDKQDVKSKTTN